MLWHYTIGDNLQRILADGQLKPTAVGVEHRETPAVWFSTEPDWEPTATKGVRDKSGKMRAATMKEMQEMGGGFCRIGIADATPGLLPWAGFVRRSGIRRRDAKRLENVARDKGGKPSRWHASLHPVPRSLWLAVEVRTETGWIASELEPAPPEAGDASVFT